ncbi:MarR family transcriptional regulator [Oenococcus sp. UCMA 17063]|nr:MarR family transcriptional regulator [Oenococcus sp. UCMA 17063]
MNKAEIINELVGHYESSVHLYNDLEKTTYNYGTHIDLYPSEIHMIAAIGRKKDSNLNQLAESLAITKGAVSKMVQKLVKKGLVTKKFAVNSENEVAVNLTAIGKIADENRKLYRSDLNKRISNIYMSVPEPTITQLQEISQKTEKLFQELVNERKK